MRCAIEPADFDALATELDRDDVIVLDVRHHELPAAELWMHCASGYRASVAASILDRQHCNQPD